MSLRLLQAAADADRGTRIAMPGLEADNLLAFLALMGMLRAIETAAPELEPRVSWYDSPWTALLHLAHDASKAEIAELVARGCSTLAESFDVDDRSNVDFDRTSWRAYATRVAGSSVGAALAAAVTAEYPPKRNSTALRAAPLVMMFGQGHQNFLERLREVPNAGVPERAQKGRSAAAESAADKIAEALFAPWERKDRANSFRWDPEEDQRYALRFGDPSRAGAAPTVHGANRLAALGLLSFTCVPGSRSVRVAGTLQRNGKVSFVWPLWKQPLGRSAIEALLGHPAVLAGDLDAVRALGVTEILRASRINNGKFLNVTRAAPHRAQREP